MNITITHNFAPLTREDLQPRAVLLLARKLQACATGLFPTRPLALFITQAQSLTQMPDVRHSVLASLEEVEGFATGS